MIRRNLDNIVYIALLLAIAIPYGWFWSSIVFPHAPLWVSFAALVGPAAAFAAALDHLSHSIVRQLQLRRHQKAFVAQARTALRCAHCGTPILGTSVSAPAAPDGPVLYWHMDADHPMCRDAFAASRTRGAAS